MRLVFVAVFTKRYEQYDLFNKTKITMLKSP